MRDPARTGAAGAEFAPRRRDARAIDDRERVEARFGDRVVRVVAAREAEAHLRQRRQEVADPELAQRPSTGVADDQFYTVIAGSDLKSIVDELDIIVSANAQLAEYHQGRRAALSTM